ncbi:TonB-dependent receptor [Mucilaginibacter sp. KACC 22063]|uniref:TonB-dependent receptor n=1 Tax=Mucilaginibacter sp. KACC 22063 TaxID=3025666 RepID=UPI002365E52B|nr:TonB-dependent receptor [Mucilaginibacter sp. KACC 22063]WDF55423.1 TonB-dependent receptor [Mucilaginibacter sp. KACC 22063]
MKKTYNYLIAALFILLHINALYAQTTGKISGKIADKKTGESLIGATVLIQGTTKGAATDVNGNYILSGVTSGTYTLLVRYVGYDTKSISDVEVKANEITHLNVVLDASQGKSLNEVVVKGTYRRESVAALYAQQKTSVQISDGISADIIRRSPDRNTGEVLKRVSGTSIQDGKFVVVRGLSDRYNSNMLNNAVLPSTEPDKKAFSFDIIPSSFVDNIIVYKTATPDLPGDFAGGLVKTISKDLPDAKFFDATVGLGYNSKTTFKSNFVSPEPHASLDFLGFDDGSRKLPSAYSNVKNNYTSGLSNAQKIAVAQKFPNTFGYETGNFNLPNLGLQLLLGNTKTTKNNNRIGYLFGFNYRTARQVTEGNRIEYNPSNTGGSNDLINYQFDRDNFTSSRTLGAILNMAYIYGKSKIAWRNLYNNDFSVNFEQTTNARSYEVSTTDPLRYEGYSNQTTQNGLYSSVLEGTHTLGAKSNFIVNWNASYGLSYRNQPDQRIVTIYTPLNQPKYISLSSENSPKPNDLGRIYSNLHENIYGGAANLTYKFNWLGKGQQLKGGGLFNYRDRSFAIDALGYVDQIGFGNKAIPFTNGVDITNVFSASSLQNNGIALARLDLSSTDYDGKAALGAGYLMLENNFTDQLHLTWGARVEHYDQSLKAAGKAKQDYVNTDVLPSANLTYNVSEKTNLRLSYYGSVNRPEFRELADYQYYDYQNNFNIRGNPNLQRSTINNADLRFEYYPSGGEILSVSAFYKHFNNPIEQVNLGNDNLSFANANSSRDFGIEMEIRKKLNFINDQNFLKNLTFYVNASYINASVSLQNRNVSTPLQGQSPYIINSGLFYVTNKGDLSFNVLYNRIGQRLAFRGQGDAIDIYERPRDVIDFQIGKALWNKRAEIKLTVSDLLHQATSLYYNYGSLDKTAYKAGEDKIIQSRLAGFGTAISFKYNFGSVR